MRCNLLLACGTLIACAFGLATSSATLQPPPQDAAIAGCWQDLASDDAAKAYRATWTLVQNPAAAVKLFKEPLSPAAAPDMEKIKTWLAELASPKFSVRDKAFKELAQQGEVAEGELRKALDGQPELETRQRIELLLGKLHGTVTSTEKVRMVRAVEVLELLGTAEAKELLERLATGLPQHRLSQEAQDSLKRLRERPAVRPFPSPPTPLPASGERGGIVAGSAGDSLPVGARVRLGTTQFRITTNQFGRKNYSARMSFSSDNRFLAMVTGDVVSIWEAQNGKMQRTLPYAAAALAFAPKGNVLALGLAGQKGKQNGALVLWDWREEKEIARMAMPETVAIQQVGFSADAGQIVAALTNGTLGTWDAKSLKETRKWNQTKSQEQIVGFSPDGSRVAVAKQKTQDFVLVDTRTNKRYPLQGIDSNSTVHFSQDGKFQVTGDFRDFKVWDTETGKVCWIGDNLTDVLWRAVISPDCKFLAAGGYRRGISLWDLRTGKHLKSLPTSQDFEVGAISPDSRWLAGTGGQTVRVWNLETGDVVNDGDGHTHAIRTLAVSPRFDVIATGGNDGTLRLWVPVTGKQKQRLLSEDQFGMVAGVCFSPDGKLLASSDLATRNSVRIWEAATGRQLFKFPGHGSSGGERTVQFTPDGRYLLSSGDDMYVCKWDVKTGKALVEKRLQRKGLKEAENFDGNERGYLDKGFFGGSTFTPQADQYVLGSHGSLIFFDAASGKELREIATGARFDHSIAISPSGKRLIAYSDFSNLSCVDLSSGKVVSTDSFSSGQYGNAQFSPDGRTVAVAAGDKIVVVEMATAKIRLMVEKLLSPTHFVTFSPDGRFLVAAMEDTTALVWHLAVLAGGDLTKKESR